MRGKSKRVLEITKIMVGITRPHPSSVRPSSKFRAGVAVHGLYILIYREIRARAKSNLLWTKCSSFLIPVAVTELYHQKRDFSTTA